MMLKIAKENKTMRNMSNVILIFNVECNAITQINTLHWYFKNSESEFFISV